MDNFKVGQRVKCINEFDGNELINDKLGTIVEVDGVSRFITVEFDEHVKGHDGLGAGEDGYCWNVPEGLLVPVDESKK